MAVAARPSEADLDVVLGQALQNDDHVLRWFVAQTKFSSESIGRVLVRFDNPWGAPKGEQAIFRETDILVVCENMTSGHRFGLHIENKPAWGKFTAGQAEDYPKRAAAWRGAKKWGAYDDWECVLVAPTKFVEKHPLACTNFNVHVDYAALGALLPEFGLLS